jgi:hypothetical protein
VTIVSPRMGNNGWPFAQVDAFPGAEVDPLFGAEHVKDLYLRANPDYDRRFTVPILWDKVTFSPTFFAFAYLRGGEQHDREQRVVRNHPHAEHGI